MVSHDIITASQKLTVRPLCSHNAFLQYVVGCTTSSTSWNNWCSVSRLEFGTLTYAAAPGSWLAQFWAFGLILIRLLRLCCGVMDNLGSESPWDADQTQRYFQWSCSYINVQCLMNHPSSPHHRSSKVTTPISAQSCLLLFHFAVQHSRQFSFLLYHGHGVISTLPVAKPLNRWPKMARGEREQITAGGSLRSIPQCWVYAVSYMSQVIGRIEVKWFVNRFVSTDVV